jgi:hypothetical protein
MTCPACQHPDREDIDIRMSQGSPTHALAAMFGLSEAVLKKHREHLRNLPVKINTNPTSVLLTLEETEKDVRTVVEMARGISDGAGGWIQKPNPELMLKAADRLVAIQLTAVKLAKELAMFKKDVISRDTFNQMVDAVLAALEEYPEAKGKVESALAELEI